MTSNEPTRPEAAKPYPGFAQSLLVLFLFFLFANLTAIPSLVFSHLKMHHWAAWALLFAQLGATALTLKVSLLLGNKEWADAFPSRSVSWWTWLLTLLTMAGLLLIINGMDGWVSHLITPPDWYQELFKTMGWPSVVLGAALSEEPIFRGLILGGFILRYGPRKAVVYSALLFGLIHLNLWQFPGAVMMGLFLGWLTLRSGSLWPAVFAHFLNNLGFTLTSSFQVTYFADQRLQPLWMWGLGLCLGVLGLAALFRTTQEIPPIE